MSLTKRRIEKEEHNKKIALDILSELGIIEVCESCEYYTAVGELTDEVYAQATNKYKDIVDEKDRDYSLFHDCLQEIYDEAGIESIDEHMLDVHMKD